MKVIKSSAKTRLEIAAPQEGDFSRDIIFDSKGILGLESGLHTDDGYKLLRVPMGIYGSLAAAQIHKQIIWAMYYEGSGWAFKFSKGANIELHSGDFNKCVKSGLIGFRKEHSGEFLLYFKAKAIKNPGRISLLTGVSSLWLNYLCFSTFSSNPILQQCFYGSWVNFTSPRFC